MESLPPELAQLAAQREAIVQQFTQGMLTQDAALASLEALSAIDGSGAVWKLNTGSDGSLFVRGEPGGLLEPCDPVYFAPFTRPADPGTGPFPESVLPAFQASSGSIPPPPSWAGDNPVGLSTGAYSGAPAPVAAPKSSRIPKVSLPGLPKLPALNSRGARIGIVAVLVVIIGAFLFLRGGSQEQTTPSGLPSPSASGSAQPQPSGSTAPDGQTTKQPTQADITRILTTLAGGDRKAIEAELATKPTPGALRGAAVRFSGFAAVGITVDAAPVASGKNGLTQVWTIRDPWQTEPVGTVTVSWKLVDGTWKLTGLPE